MVLLVLLLAVQGVHSLLLLVLRPHISVLVGAVECSCACLDLASWVPVFLAYSGAGSSAQVSSSQVGLQAWGLQRGGSMMGRLGWQRMLWEALHGQHSCVLDKSSPEPPSMPATRRPWTPCACFWLLPPWPCSWRGLPGGCWASWLQLSSCSLRC